jgi:hypothetical protein
MSDRIVIILTLVLVLMSLSAIISAVTAWLALAVPPKLAMTRPTFVAFGFDGPDRVPKVFTRTLLHCTSGDAAIVELIYVTVKQSGKSCVYPYWGYQTEGKLVAGGGLVIGREGFLTDHHFVLGKNSHRHWFEAGPLTVMFHLRVVGNGSDVLLFKADLKLPPEHAKELNAGRSDVAFQRSPEADEFRAAVLPQLDAPAARPVTIATEVA